MIYSAINTHVFIWDRPYVFLDNYTSFEYVNHIYVCICLAGQSYSLHCQGGIQTYLTKYIHIQKNIHTYIHTHIRTCIYYEHMAYSSVLEYFELMINQFLILTYIYVCRYNCFELHYEVDMGRYCDASMHRAT